MGIGKYKKAELRKHGSNDQHQQAAQQQKKTAQSGALLLVVSLCVCLLLAGGVYAHINALPPFSTPAGQEANMPPVDPVEPSLPVTDLPAQTEEPEEPPAPILALTFDDGPNGSVTPLLIEALNERGIHATFFVLGRLVERYPEVIAQAYSAGHQIASHGWDHENSLTKLSDQQLAKELSDTALAIYNITGENPAYLRPPYGSMDKKTAAKIDVPMMLWTIDPRDWELKDAEKLEKAILDTAYDGGVLLLHDLYETTMAGALAAIDKLQAEGWRFLSLEEYYQHYGMELEPGQLYRGTALASR